MADWIWRQRWDDGDGSKALRKHSSKNQVTFFFIKKTKKKYIHIFKFLLFLLLYTLLTTIIEQKIYIFIPFRCKYKGFKNKIKIKICQLPGRFMFFGWVKCLKPTCFRMQISHLPDIRFGSFLVRSWLELPQLYSLLIHFFTYGSRKITPDPQKNLSVNWHIFFSTGVKVRP